LWIGTKGQIERELIPRAGITLETIDGGAIAGVSWPARIYNGTKLVLSLVKAMRIIGNFRPDSLLMTGGYVNFPVALAAKLRRIPAAIYLPDIEPGMAIRYLSRVSDVVACTAADSQIFFRPGKTVVTGYPVRQTLRQASTMSRESALTQFNLSPERSTLFITGGSRGAQSINRAVLKALPELLKEIQVIHLTGSLDWPNVKALAEGLPANKREFYRSYPYAHEEIGAAFRAADLVLARAGASMLGECPTFGVPAVLVPYPFAWRYQKVNADYLVERGAAIRINDEHLSEKLLTEVLPLLRNKTLLDEMTIASRRLDVPSAADRLADVVTGLVKRKLA